MRILKHHQFAKWMKKIGLADVELKRATEEIENGLIDANLGGGLIKKRIASANKGKRGGIRTLLAFKQSHRSIYIYGFGKNKKSNITEKEQQELKLLTRVYLSWDENQLNKAIKIGELVEVM